VIAQEIKTHPVVVLAMLSVWVPIALMAAPLTGVPITVV